MDFSTIMDILRSNLDFFRANELIINFDRMQSYEDIFRYFWRLDETQQYLKVLAPPPCKTELEAECHLAKANKLYKEKKYEASLEYYNKSIRKAPHPEISLGEDETEHAAGENPSESETTASTSDSKKYKTLAYSYLNRSAALLMLREYDKCLLDLELAVKCGYSGLKLSILEERKAMCFQAKEQGGAASEEEITSSNSNKIPPRLREPSASVPCFNDCVNVTYSLSKGTHVVATRDIRPGELIAVEKSYCYRLYATESNNYCPVCFLQYISPVPCPCCSMVVFCSDSCRMKGLKYHLKECKILSVVDSLGICKEYVNSLALKILLHTTFLELKEKLPILFIETKVYPAEKLGFDENGKYISSDYRTAYHLANARRKMSSNQSLFTSLIVAFVLVKVFLQTETFFVDSSGLPIIPSEEDIVMTGAALLHHLNVYPNVFFLNDIQANSTNTHIKTTIGDALFPALMLMRHACNAPTIQYNFADVMVVRAVMPIASGQEVTLSRGDFLATTLVFRRLQFGSLGLECFCEACEEDWPVITNFPVSVRLRCVKCRNPLDGTVVAPVCTTCNIDYNEAELKGEKKSLLKKWWATLNRVNDADKKFAHVSYKIQTGKTLTKEDFSDTCYYADLLYRNATQPSAVLYKIRNALLVFFCENNKFTV